MALDQPRPTWCVLLNEWNAPWLLILALTGRKPCVIDEMPLTFLGGRLLKKLVAFLQRRDALVQLPDLLPETRRFWGSLKPFQLSNVIEWLPQLYDSLAELYKHRELDVAVPEYAAAVKACSGNFIQLHVVMIFIVRDLVKSGRNFILAGFDDDLNRLYSDYWKEDMPLPRRLNWQPRWFVNIFTTLAGVAIMALRTAKFLRLTPLPPEPRLLAVDQLDDATPRNVRLAYQFLSEDEQKPLFVVRYPGMLQRADCMSYLKDEDHCTRLAGFLTPRDLPGAFRLIADSFSLLRVAGGMHPAAFRPVVALAYWRLVYRALFNKIKPQFFLCRDDYTAEHHTRSRELRRIGGKTIGLRHGVCWGGLLATYCHIDFDLFYHYGDMGSLEFYRTKWPSHMAIRGVGTWGMTRQERRNLPRIRTRDVLVCTSNAPGGQEVAESVGFVAQALNDRIVHFRPKAEEYPSAPDLTKAIRRVLDAPPENVRIQSSQDYSGFADVGYLITNASSMAAEAIQFGICAFVLDAGFDHPEPWTLIYRQYPFILVPDMSEAVRRIHQIEAGEWRYPAELAADLIEMGGRNVFDVIRQDMGLQPLEPGDEYLPWPQVPKAS
ncbi:hypothetical protein [Magnetospirillum sp. 64-120]|uniref:hypothetical protein n=1 Tax=Magnetospirillum sp. 64-120 TaxID=1895778 RepID=UPI0025C364D0|nr:hypothetical protein [Magnetospirillum sp. 64-120]